MMYKQAMKVPVLLLIVGVTFMLCGQVSTSCSCSGYVASKGRGECKTTYRFKKYCFVNPGLCSDQIKSSFSSRFWSYQACEKSISPLPQVHKTQLLRALAEPVAQRTTPVGRERGTVTQTTRTPVSQVSAPLIITVNKDGFIYCQTREDCPPNFETSNYFDSFSYWCRPVYYETDETNETWTGGICDKISGHYYNLNKDGFINCQTREDCPPNFETSNYDRVSYGCRQVYNETNETWIGDICDENSSVACGNGKRAKDCGDCGTTEEECGRFRGGCYIDYCFYGNGTRSLPNCYGKIVGGGGGDRALGGGSPLTRKSAIGGTGISSATNPDRYVACGPRYCRRGNKCCLLVSIGWSNRYLGCPSYC